MSGIFFVGQCFKNNYFDFYIRGKTSYTFLFEVCLCLAKSLSLPQACTLKKSCSHLTCEHQWLWISLVSMATQTLYSSRFSAIHWKHELSFSSWLVWCLGVSDPGKKCLCPDSGLLIFLHFSLVSSVLWWVQGKLWFCRSFIFCYCKWKSDFLSGFP